MSKLSVNKEIIDKLRETFMALVEQDGQSYHKDDVERVQSNDWWIERFVLVTKSEDAALKALDKAMKWRKSYGVNDFTDDYFPKEIYKIGYCFTFPNKDKENRPVVWFIGKNYHKSNELSQLFRQFVVYQYEKADRSTSHEGWAIVQDPSGSGLSNMDLDLSNFIVDVLQSYYPRGTKYSAVVELPWILNATAKIIMAFMGEELKKTVKFIKKVELTDYLDPEYIPVHLKGSYDKELTSIPEGVKPLEELTHTTFTNEQIKKIYSTFKEELK